MGFTGVTVLAVYLAGVVQGHGEIVATEQLMWLLGAGILGITLGLLIFDP